MTPRGLKDPAEVEKATEAAQEPVPEAQPGRIPDPYLSEVGPDHPDAALVELWRQRNDLVWPLRLEEIDFATPQEEDAYAERITEIDRRIDIPAAATIVGLAIKARLYWQDQTGGRHPTPWAPIEAGGYPDGSEEYALYSLVSDAVRLAMADSEAARAMAPRGLQDPEAVTSDPIVDLVEKVMAFRRDTQAFATMRPSDPGYEKGEALFTEGGALEKKLLGTIPTTPQGVALLWQFLEEDLEVITGDPDPYRTCLRNLRKAIGQMAVPWLEDAPEDDPGEPGYRYSR